jgi:tRNA dimethylallyltransferase
VERAPAPGAFAANWLALGVRVDRKEMHARIERRLDARLAAGMLDEARHLHEAGLPWERMEWFGLEYRYMALHLQGKMGLREMRDALLVKIRQFAKRQDSWFRKMEREGLRIHWLAPDDFEKGSALIRRFLAGEPLPEPDFRLMDVKYGPSSS